MIRAEMKILVTGSRRDEILRTLKWLMSQLEGEPGLEEMDLYRSCDRENKVALVQRWRGHEDLVRYMRSEEFVRLLEILDLSEEPPELNFDTISQRQGLEFVEEVRREESVIR